MNQLRVHLRQGVSIEPNVPLHKRVPIQDEEGKPLSDFIMLIPGLKQASSVKTNLVVAGLHAALRQHKEVIFADLNVSRSMLWVSVRAIPGVIPEIAAAIQTHVPEALIVASP